MIRTQLQNPEHPVNVLAARFSFYYCRHYTNQLLFDETSRDFYMFKKTPSNKGDIHYVSEQERKKIEDQLIGF